ncbi:MAG: hypothetical protein EPO06_08795 [Burkholderiaceae bacterium]|nr:MAG: hypothetical protein EPO06_08795 [Burkholderiaceae bacterium]
MYHPDFHAPAKIRKVSLTLFQEGELNPKTQQTIFRDDQPRFRTLSVGNSEEIKNVLQAGNGFRVRIARRTGTPRQASQLLEKRFGSRGYSMPAQWDDPSVFTFMEYQDGELVGTVGVRLDSPTGLAADKTHPEIMRTLRAHKLRLCEYTRLAVEDSADSITALGTLFHSAYLWAGVVHDFNYCVIEVNPRHATFYQRLLKFKALGQPVHNRSVNAPAVLLGISFTDIEASLRKRHASSTQSGSAFSYGFSEAEAATIVFELEQVKIEHTSRKSADSDSKSSIG